LVVGTGLYSGRGLGDEVIGMLSCHFSLLIAKVGDIPFKPVQKYIFFFPVNSISFSLVFKKE
jgi:hypothetical protein